MTLKREELLQLLGDLGELYPEMRFGQLLESVAMWSSQTKLNTVGDVTDEELVEATKEHLRQQTNERHAGALP